MTDDLRYPIGKFTFPKSVDANERESMIREIAETPERLQEALAGLSDEQLDTPYRPGGWTVRQVVHHLPDSHLNSYLRFKLAVTEDEPTIVAYDESRWAELADARNAPIEASLQLLTALHERWVMFLRSLTEDQYERRFLHPDLGAVEVGKNVALYAWHGRHHVAHIKALRERERWR
jgi:uncharacterized damage-inducible protein DinB